VKRLLIPAYVALMIKLLAMCTPPNDDGNIVLPSSPAPALVDPADDPAPVVEEGAGGVASRADSKLKATPELKPKRSGNGRKEVARPYARPRASGVA
jgi:hypothetical protein